jgi:hypothetical protein
LKPRAKALTRCDQTLRPPDPKLPAVIKDAAGGLIMRKFLRFAERGLVLLGILGVIAMILSHTPDATLPQQQGMAQPTAADVAPAGPVFQHLSSR